MASKPINFKEFLALFPTDEACFKYIIDLRYPNTTMKRVKGRMAVYDRSGKFTYPLKGTIFQATHVPLTKWFYVIFLFANAKNGISAAEVQRQIGVTYKVAWRMCSRIRSLMGQDGSIRLSGIVEADETYIGGRSRLNSWKKPKMAVVGLIERDGRLVTKLLSNKSEFEIAPFVEKHLHKGSTLYTDSAPVYNTLRGFKRGRVIHTRKEFARGPISTNRIENHWSKVKTSIKGTYSGSISPKHLQSYLDVLAFHHNNRGKDIFHLLVQKI